MNKILPAILFSLCIFSFASAQSSLGDDKSAMSSPFQNDRMIQKPKVEVYQNPAVENIFVRIESQDAGKIEIEFFNIIGSSLKVETEELEKNYYRIGIKELPAGYYLLMVKDPVKRFSQAFKIHKTNK